MTRRPDDDEDDGLEPISTGPASASDDDDDDGLEPIGTDYQKRSRDDLEQK
jgi:hypothetical protein